MKLEWKKSTRCETNGCVEVAKGRTGDTPTVLVRPSDSPGRVLKFTQLEWDDFVAGVKQGDFD